MALFRASFAFSLLQNSSWNRRASLTSFSDFATVKTTDRSTTDASRMSLMNYYFRSVNKRKRNRRGSSEPASLRCKDLKSNENRSRLGVERNFFSIRTASRWNSTAHIECGECSYSKELQKCIRQLYSKDTNITIQRSLPVYQFIHSTLGSSVS